MVDALAAAVAMLAIAGSWAAMAAVVVGCGVLVRRAREASVADFWIGLAALVAYLQAWTLVGGIGWATWIAPLALGVGGLVLAWRAPRALRPRPGVVVGLGLGVLWLANRALGDATDYDLGLYHLGVMEHATQFGTVPGLGNLHDRLGAGNGHLLLVAFLDAAPWPRSAIYLANGLLAALLFAEVAARLGRARLREGLSFAQRLALLLVPATVVTIGVGSEYRLTSPNLDLAAFLLVAVGTLYLADCLTSEAPAAASLACLSAFGLAAVTRPLFLLPAVVAGGLILARRPRRIAVVVLPLALAAGWAARQALLTGYPLFPLTLGGLPAGWRMPAVDVEAMSDVVRAWARTPGSDPSEVLGSWSWLPAWLSRRLRDPDAYLPLLYLACLVPALAVRAGGRPVRLPAALAVLAPAVAALVPWFLVAPDPRFALAPIWLVPAVLLAWGLPRLRGRGPLLAYAALGTVTVAGVIILAQNGAFDPFGPVDTSLRRQNATEPALEPFVTDSGLVLRRPRDGDRCFRAVACTPQPDRRLRLRADGIADGFVKGAGAGP
jgi:hypothetical protein